jgi:cation transport regulator ChaC
MSGAWVFGYGSLVSPESFGYTLGRVLVPGVDFFEAEVAGYGRRWNYGVMSTVGESVGADGVSKSWTIVALGLVASPDETVNGVVCWVTGDELPMLDRRERDYDRVDVSDQATICAGAAVDPAGPIMTYVPRPEPQQRYRAARDSGTAAIEQRYWDLVDGAFADLGADRRERYHATTPAPDVPVVAMTRDSVPARHLVRRRQ